MSVVLTFRHWLSLAIVVTLCWFSATASAVTHTQAPAALSLVWNAVDYDSLTNPDADAVNWITLVDANALAGSALQANVNPGQSDTATPLEGIVNYKLNFSSSGTYRLYARYRVQDTNLNGVTTDNDSLFVPVGAVATPNERFGVNIDALPDATRPNVGFPSPDALYHWKDFGGTDGNFFVRSADQIGVDVTLSLGIREEGLTLDKLVLVRRVNGNAASGLTELELDLIVTPLVAPTVPEPATAALGVVGLAGLVLGASRRRKA